ncbi:LA2681 family HEPN domain-containing protein [Psychrobacter aquimaris]|uniref:LA2681 family HEPN domain-containing protein n=1 Tax=Psychrobacter aquimaris TaxID=292733 RepID=UPI003FD2D21D
MKYRDQIDFENINFQLESASRMIDLGNFNKSFKLCLDIENFLNDAVDEDSAQYSFLFYKLGMLFVDLGNMASNMKASALGIAIMESGNFEGILARESYYYNLGNAKSNLLQIKSEDETIIKVELVRQLSEVNSLFWKSILSCRKQGIEAQPQYLVNLAINLQKQHRYSEALALYDQVIVMDLDIPQAWISRSECLSLLSQINNFSSIKQGREIALGFRNASKSNRLPPIWAKSYLMRAEKIDKDIEKNCLDMGVDIEDDSNLDKQEYQSLSEYRKWCLDNFLSLSEHGLYCKCYGSARDNLTIPLTTRSISGDFIYFMEKVLNRLKSEFGLARLMLFEYGGADIDKITEDEACYSELYDNELLGINIEKLRTAFRICFGILDKIGNAIALLFDLQPRGKNNKVRNASFHTFWELDKKERLEKFNSYGNAGLIGLYSIACDLNYSLKGELNFYKQWRNALEHSFVFIYDDDKPEENQSLTNYYGEPEFISKAEFIESAEHVLQLTRSAIFSFVYAVRIKAKTEEVKKSEHLFQYVTIQRKNYILNI